MIVTPLGDGRFRVSDGERERTAWAAGPSSARWVFFDGRVYLVSATDRDRGESRAAHDDLALASPMPATVASVNVAPGQTVARGEVLIMLEAMKMELPITAPRDGRIRSVACKPGELVEAEAVLLELQ